MAQLESCLTSYVRKYVSPEVVGKYKQLVEEDRKYLESRDHSTIYGSVYGSAGIYDSRREDKFHFSPSDTKRILDSVSEKLSGDAAMSQDIGSFIEGWKALYIKHYGKERYDALSRNVDCGDLATYYVNRRIRDLMLESLAKEKVPQSSLAYVFDSAVKKSLIGMGLNFFANKDKQQEFEMVSRLYNPSTGEKIASEAAAFAIDVVTLYPISGGAGIAGKLIAKGVNSATLDTAAKLEARYGTEMAEKFLEKGMKYGSWAAKHGGKAELAGFELFERANSFMSTGGPAGDQDLSLMLFGDKEALKHIRDEKGIDNNRVQEIVNGSLNKKVLSHVSQSQVSALTNEFHVLYRGSGSEALESMKKSLGDYGLAYLPQKKVPEWMKKKCNEDNCIRNAGYFLSVAREMQNKGVDKLKVGKTVFTLKEATQRAYDYARAADWFHQQKAPDSKEQVLDRLNQNEEYLRSMGMLDGKPREHDVTDSQVMQNIRSSLHKNGLAYQPDHQTPAFMAAMTEEQLSAAAKQWRNKAVSMQSQKKESVNIQGIGRMTLQEVTQRAYDYASVADAKFKAAREEKLALKSYSEDIRQQSDSWDNNMKALNAVLEEPSPAVRQDSNIHQALLVNDGKPVAVPAVDRSVQASQPVKQASQQVQPRVVNPIDQNLGGWQDMLEQLGLGGLAHLGSGLGDTMTVMPELLAGMFKGRIKNFRFSDNMLPLGLIMAGLFVSKRSHPVLKLLLLVLGAALLLGNANAAVHGKEATRIGQQPSYKRYEEEELNPRIKNPQIKGNTLIADIDGNHLVLTINEDRAIDAFQKGAVPFNNLCNAALRSYDEQGGWSSRSYEQEVSRQQEQTEDRVRGLR